MAAYNPLDPNTPPQTPEQTIAAQIGPDPNTGTIPNMPVVAPPVEEVPVDASAFAPPPATPQQQMQPLPKAPEFGAANKIEQSFSREQAALKAAADAGALKAKEQSAMQDQLQKDLEEKALKYKTIQENLESRSNEELAKLDDVRKKTSEFQYKDFWEDKSAGQKIMSGIAIALGGMGAALQGTTENAGLSVINKAIEDDLRLQKLNYEKMLQQGEQSRGILSEMYKQYDNKLQAENATKILMLDRAQVQLQSIANKYESPELKAKANMANEQLERQKVMAVEQFKQQTKQQQLLQQISSNGADMRNLQPQQVAQIDELQKGFSDRYVPGWGPAVNKEAATEFRKYAADTVPAIEGTKRILELSKNLNRVTDLSKKAQIATETKALVGQLRLPFTGPGALTEKEYVRLLETVGDPTSLASLPNLEKIKLQTVLKKLSIDLNNRAQQAGMTPQMPAQEASFTKKFGK